MRPARDKHLIALTVSIFAYEMYTLTAELQTMIRCCRKIFKCLYEGSAASGIMSTMFTCGFFFAWTLCKDYTSPPESTQRHGRPISVFNAVRPESPKITGNQYSVLALSLAHRDFWRLSESFDNIMSCKWWHSQPSEFHLEDHYFEIVLWTSSFWACSDWYTIICRNIFAHW